jgi:hypothetical protein
MKEKTVHLEDVTRAARQGLALAASVAVAVLAGTLAAGASMAIALLASALVLGLGSASGGFGLVARVALRCPRRRRRPRAVASQPVAQLRVPQTR